MRIYFVLFWWAAISPLWCQEPNLAQQLQRYQERIAMTTHGERLVWMDSLTSAVEFQAEHHYDSLARATIDFALAEDSLAIAADNISDLIYYRKSYLGDPSQAVELFKQYEFL
ncbi:MAG: hypothetical protein R2793_04705 [Flavobacteriaceae bacterium]